MLVWPFCVIFFKISYFILVVTVRLLRKHAFVNDPRNIVSELWAHKSKVNFQVYPKCQKLPLLICYFQFFYCLCFSVDDFLYRPSNCCLLILNDFFNVSTMFLMLFNGVVHILRLFYSNYFQISCLNFQNCLQTLLN